MLGQQKYRRITESKKKGLLLPRHKIIEKRVPTFFDTYWELNPGPCTNRAPSPTVLLVIGVYFLVHLQVQTPPRVITLDQNYRDDYDRRQEEEAEEEFMAAANPIVRKSQAQPSRDIVPLNNSLL